MTDIEPTSATPAVVEDRSPAWHRNKDRMDMARALARSEAIPKRYWGRPDDIFATVLHGEELGLSPSIALVNIYMIDGTPTFAARFVLGLMLRAGLIQFRERSDERVVVYGRRPNGTHLEVTWTMADAKRAGLADKQNWKRYPRQMLTARAVTELGRTLFADDLILGEAYTPDEVGHVGVYDAIDVDDSYVPAGIDATTGEILDDNVDDDTPARQVEATLLDAEDAMDAEWIADARGDQLDLEEDR
jgi:hypothetical protein